MQAVELKKEVKTGGRVVVLNALPINVLHAIAELRNHRNLLFAVTFYKDVEQFKSALMEDAAGREIVHYISHPGTVKALRDAGIPISPEPNRGLYEPRLGDKIYVAALKKPVRGEDVPNPADFIFAKLVY
jgi:hypothetical protein